MTIRKASYLQGTVPAPYKLPAEDHRLNRAGLWMPSNTGGLRVRNGIVPAAGNPGAVTVVAGGVNINPFTAAINGSVSTTQGVYEVTSDAVEFRAITAASATEFRRGYVMARVYDQLNAGAGPVKDEAAIEVIYGAPAATAGAAVAPPAPANTLNLQAFLVSNTGVITLEGNPAVQTVARGAIQPVRADNAEAPSYDGQYRDHATFGLQRALGGAWGDPLPDGSGTALLTSAQPAATVPPSQLWGPGILTIVGQRGGIVALPGAPAADRIVIVRPGLYAVYWRYTTGSASPSGTLTAYLGESFTGTVHARSPHLNGSDTVGGATLMLNITAANQRVLFAAYTVHAGNVATSTEMRIARLGSAF